MAERILEELFEGEEPGQAEPRDRTFPLTGFQESGLGRARDIIGCWGGVVIADGVGLGKTYIALALIEEELQRGGTVVAAIPAALRPVWRGPLRRLGTRHPRATVRLLSHAQLSRGGYPPGLSGRVALIVVDEAHRFRNQKTRRYAALRAMCDGARVALLTATPVNNGVADLHGLLTLFADDDAFVGLGIPSLSLLLRPGVRRGSAAGADPDPPALRRLLRAVMIRRTRRATVALAGSGRAPPHPLRFPVRSPPRLVPYDEPRIPELVRAIQELELSPYHVPAAAPGGGDGSLGGGGGIAALVRLGLLKRLESSPAALRASTGRLSAFCGSFLSALEAGRLLRPREPGRSRGGDADPFQLVLFDLVAGPIPPEVDPVSLAASVRRDAARLQAMDRLLNEGDPKLAALRRLLEELAPDKVVVFTEFRDTAEALWRPLAGSLRVARIDGAGAWLGRQKAGRGAVVQRFAPAANGAHAPPARERVDVLVATDVLAEGMNLQDARHVVSYDLPWNPVRLLQRIGRIDRLGSPHATVVPHLFAPNDGLEDVLGLTRRLRRKLGDIAGSVGGADSAMLLQRLSRGGLDAAAALDRIEAHQEDALETLRAIWAGRGEIRPGAGPAGSSPRPDATSATAAAAAAAAAAATAATSASEAVPVARVGLGAEHSAGAVVLVRFRGSAWLLEVDRGGVIHDAGDAVVEAVHTALGRPARHVGDPENLTAPLEIAPARTLRRLSRLVHRHFATMAEVARAPRPVGAADPAARLARRLRSAMATSGAWADPELLSRADRALQRLGRRLPAPARHQARLLLTGLGPAVPAADLLDRLERVLGSVRDEGNQGGDGDSKRGAEASILAVLILAREGPKPPLSPG